MLLKTGVLGANLLVLLVANVIDVDGVAKNQQFGPSDGSAGLRGTLAGEQRITGAERFVRVQAGKEFYIVVTGQSDQRNVPVEHQGVKTDAQQESAAKLPSCLNDSRADPKWPRGTTAKCEAVNCNTQPILNRSHISGETGTYENILFYASAFKSGRIRETFAPPPVELLLSGLRRQGVPCKYPNVADLISPQMEYVPFI
jgi:hypothetical protein